VKTWIASSNCELEGMEGGLIKSQRKYFLMHINALISIIHISLYIRLVRINSKPLMKK